MAKEFKNKLTGQIGEYLACVELGKRGYIATSFSGNVPEFDLLIADKKLRTLPIQVKTSRNDSWRTNASEWIDLTVDDENKTQIDNGDKEIDYPKLIYIYIALGSNDEKSRFFILTKELLQEIIVNHYRNDMNARNWKRPKNYKSFDCRFKISEIQKFEDN